MKLRHSLLGVGLLLMGAGLTPAVAETFRPERGVRCDDVEQICYYRGSPSVEMTRQYFGRDAARALRWNLRREEPRWPERVFYPEPGVRCDRAEQVCFNRRGEPSFRLTRDHLGYDAARRLERRPGPDWDQPNR
ncbi:MAG: Fels Prophage Protein-like [Proteobacteria bacterium]|nr:Fels Prophage Protein-like [Pseudomonadota bacterium]